MKKWAVFDRLAIVFFNLFLLLLSIMLPAVCIASSPAFYQAQFEKTGIYASVDNDGNEVRKTIRYIDGKSTQYAQFSDEQLDEIIEHIVAYLFTDQESFALTMDGVYLNGTTQNDVSVFGEVACKHMVDVKELFSLVVIVTIVMGVLLLGLGGYLIWRRKHVAPLLLKYSLIFYGVFFALVGAFCGWVAIDAAATKNAFADQMWTNIHHLFFPFQADEFAGSFFNDTLTSVLTLDFFLNAVSTVLIVMGITLVLWFASTVVCKKLSK